MTRPLDDALAGVGFSLACFRGPLGVFDGDGLDCLDTPPKSPSSTVNARFVLARAVLARAADARSAPVRDAEDREGLVPGRRFMIPEQNDKDSVGKPLEERVQKTLSHSKTLTKRSIAVAFLQQSEAL